MTAPPVPTGPTPPALPADLASQPVLSGWVRIADDGGIEVYAGKVELGQGIATTLLQVAAHELAVAPAAIRLTCGDTDRCPDQGMTAGSLSTEAGAMALRQACAEVRQRFTEAAARRLGVPAEAVRLLGGRFGTAPGSADLGYADLAAEVDLDQPARGDVRPQSVAARPDADPGLQRPDLLRKLFGAGFIHDIAWPGMLHGRVVRPPAAAARLLGIDDTALAAVRALPGVRCVAIDGRWLAVAAEREPQALAAAEALRAAVRWDLPPNGPATIPDGAWLRPLPSLDTVIDERRPDAGSAVAVQRLEADYSRPFLAHASIGPSCALARWEDGHLTVCSHSQGVFALRRELAMLLDLDAARITVVHADGAGCYGHNGADDVAVDAALLARAAGAPVRLQWSREDEFAWSPLGSAMSIHVSAGLDARGRIVDWNHDTWSHTHVQRPGTVAQPTCLASSLRDPPATPPPLRDFPLPAGGGQRNAIPIYALPARRIGYHLTREPVLRTSALRTLGGYANVFAIESAMDELAGLAGQDPLAFRRAHLDDPRAIAVLDAAATAAGWDRPKAPPRRDGAARGRGLALARYKNSSAWCAVVVEIEVTDRVVLEAVWVAVDAGEVVHRDGLVNQIEGGVLQAASWTLKEAVPWSASEGVLVRSWDDYPILAFSELPRTLQVEVLAQPARPPLGVGECAAGPTAGAIGNALADALGVRMRHLPFTPERLREALV